MKLLLLKDVRKLGHLGDVVDVRSGYGRNYLLPQRMATWPTDENIKAIEADRKRAAAERTLRLKEYNELAAKMTDVTVTIEAAANPEGTLYGSVGPKDVAVALQAQGFGVKPEQVLLDPPIRTLDNRVVTIEFTDEVSVRVKVWVVREGDAGGEHAAEAADAADAGGKPAAKAG